MPCRRQFAIHIATGAGLLSSTSTRAQSAKSYDSPGEWMDSWVKDTRAAKGFLYLARFQDPTYVVTKSIGWQPSGSQDAGLPHVVVPFGFVTDLATIPRLFWSALRPDGNYAFAAIVHDYLYWVQPVARPSADKIFKYCMLDSAVDAATAEIIYRAVEAGGEQAWTDNAKLKGSGEKRILKVLPDNPSITWAEWKTRDVF